MSKRPPQTPRTPGILGATETPRHRLTVFGRLRAYFLAGVLVTAPAAITFYLAWVFIAFIDNQVGRVLPDRYNPENYLPFSVPGLGVLVVLIFLTVVGAFAAGFLGRLLLRWSEYAVARMPVIRSVYGALKQILETVLATQSTAFRQVVLVEYPRRDMWVLGFVSGTTKGEVQRRTSGRILNVFVPTTPNPTSGFLVFVAEADTIALDMTIEEAIKMVISGGIVAPPDRNAPPEPNASPYPAVKPQNDGQPQGAATSGDPPGSSQTRPHGTGS